MSSSRRSRPRSRLSSSHNQIHHEIGDEGAIKERLDIALSRTIPKSGDNTTTSVVPEDPTTPYRTTVSTMAAAPDTTAQPLVDPRADEDVRSTNSTRSGYSCFSETIFGDMDNKRDAAFKQQRLLLQGWLTDFSSQYDALKPDMVDDAHVEIQNRANGIDIYRTKIYDHINNWITELHSSFSSSRNSERVIFERLLTWVKTATRILTRRPPFYPMGEVLDNRMKFPPDNFILPPQRSRSTSTKRRPQPEDDTSILAQQPPNKQNAATSRPQEPLTPHRRLPETPMFTDENQDPIITAPVFSVGAAIGQAVGAAVGGITATQTVQTLTTTTTTGPGPSARAAAAFFNQAAAPADAAATADSAPADPTATAQKTLDVKPKTTRRKATTAKDAALPNLPTPHPCGLREARAVLNDAHQRAKKDQNDLTSLRSRVDALTMQNDSETRQRVADWIPSDADLQQRRLADRAERAAREKVDEEIQQVIADNNAVNAEATRLKTVYDLLLSNRERLDISEEARRTQDAMSLAETAAASSATGPDYVTIGKGQTLKTQIPQIQHPK